MLAVATTGAFLGICGVSWLVAGLFRRSSSRCRCWPVVAFERSRTVVMNWFAILYGQMPLDRQDRQAVDLLFRGCDKWPVLSTTKSAPVIAAGTSVRASSI